MNCDVSILEIIRDEISKSVVGREELIEQAMLTVVTESHSQLEGVAGVGRWLVVQSLAKCLGFRATKIRCSADLRSEDLVYPPLPADENELTPAGRGPLFRNLVLVENIARLPPKLQNVIHQAMQERIVEAHGKRWSVPNPFVVFATRSPDERNELDDAGHDDRFLFRVAVRYPPYHEEFNVAQATVELAQNQCEQVVGLEQLARLQRNMSSILVPDGVVHYAVRLARATRVHEGENLDFMYEWVQQGAGPRAVRDLVLAARARSALHGRSEATHDDVRAVAHSVLRHRILTNQNAQTNGITPDRVIDRLLEDVPPRVEGDDRPPQRGESLSFHNWVPVTE